MQRIEGLSVVDCFGKEDTDIRDRIDNLSIMLVKYIQRRLYSHRPEVHDLWDASVPVFHYLTTNHLLR